MAATPNILLISNFLPPFGGVSNQARKIVEQASIDLSLVVHVLDGRTCRFSETPSGISTWEREGEFNGQRPTGNPAQAADSGSRCGVG